MMIDTGRRRQLTWSGTLQVDTISEIRAEVDDPIDPEPYVARAVFGDSGASQDWGPLSWSVRLETGAQLVAGASFTGLTWRLTAQLGADPGQVLLGSVPAPTTTPSVTEATFSAAWSLSFEAEERLTMESLDPEDTEVIDGVEWPTFAGIAVPCDLPARRARYFEVVPAGGQVSLQVTAQGQSLTLIAVAPTEMTVPYPVRQQARMFAQTAAKQGEAPVATGEARFSLELNDQAVLVPWPGGVDAQGGEVGPQHARARAIFNPSSHEAEIDHIVAPPLRWECPMAVRGMAGDLPMPVPAWIALRRERNGGTWAKSAQLVKLNPAQVVQADAELWVATGATSIQSFPSDDRAEWQPVRAWLDAAGRAEAGDDPRDLRLMIRGRRFPVAEVTLDPVTLLDDGSGVGWSGAAIPRGGFLEISGPALRSFALPVDAEGHRWLRLRLRSSAGTPLTVRIGDKRWMLTVPAGPDFQDIPLDLCLPQAQTGGPLPRVDDQESRFPLAANGLPVDGSYWGVSRISAVELDGLAPGGVVELDEIALWHREPVRISVLPGFEVWRNRQTGSPAQVRSLLWREAEGRLRDHPDHQRETGQHTWLTLGQTLAELGASPGWTVTPRPGPDSIHGLGSPTMWLAGAGAAFGSQGWEWGVDQALPFESDTWIAHALWDEVMAYPGAGDIFGLDGGGYHIPTVVPFGQILRSRAWGLALGPSGEAESGVRVAWQAYPSGDDAGQGVSGARGRFATGLPHGRGARAHRARRASDLQASGVRASRDRGVYRVAFAPVVTETNGLAYDVGADQSHWLAHARPDGLALARFDNAGNGEFTPTTRIARGVSLAVMRGGRPERAIFLFSEGNPPTITRAESRDGRTLSQLMTIAPGKNPALCLADDGTEFAYWIDGSQLMGRIADRRGQVLAAPFVVRSGVDDAPIAVQESYGPTGVRRLILWAQVNGVLQRWVSTNGRTFA